MTAPVQVQLVRRIDAKRPCWILANPVVIRAEHSGRIEPLTLLIDNDESGVRRRAEKKCRIRREAAGVEVSSLVPGVLGADFNDAVLA
jgi:hypothetical protein